MVESSKGYTFDDLTAFDLTEDQKTTIRPDFRVLVEGAKMNAKMKKSQSRDRGALPPVQALAFPETEFSRELKSRLVELDAVKREHERKWGIGRVITLVPNDFRERFYAQSERVWVAQHKYDSQKLKAACDGMVRAFKAMDAWAQSEGLEPISQVKAVEQEIELGMMVVVQSEADAVQYQALRPDVKQVWTIEELGKLVGAGIGLDLWNLKEQIPMRGFVASVVKDGAQLPLAKPVAAWGPSGFEDMENDLDLTEPDTLPKMFHHPSHIKRKSA